MTTGRGDRACSAAAQQAATRAKREEHQRDRCRSRPLGRRQPGAADSSDLEIRRARRLPAGLRDGRGEMSLGGHMDSIFNNQIFTIIENVVFSDTPIATACVGG